MVAIAAIQSEIKIQNKIPIKTPCISFSKGYCRPSRCRPWWSL